MAKQKVFEVVAEGKGDRARRVYRVGVDSEEEARAFVENHEQGLVDARLNLQAQASEMEGGNWMASRTSSDQKLSDVKKAIAVQLHDLRSVQDEPFKVKSVKSVSD